MFNEKEYYKILFKVVIQMFVVLLHFSGSLGTKCISLNDELYMTKPYLIDLNLHYLHFYPFMVILDKCNGSFNTIDDP